MIITNPFSVSASSQDRIDDSSGGWWVILVTGLISVVAGGIILVTDWTVGDLVAFVGALFVIRGIFTTFSAPLDDSGRGWSVVLGLLEVGVGLAVWAWPGPTLLVLAVFI